MKVKILYYELKEKEFRSQKALQKFLRTLLPSEILRAVKYEKGIGYMLEICQFINENRVADE